MAKIIRSAKSAIDWTENELKGYHVGITTMTPETFFHAGTSPSLDHIEAVVLTTPSSTILEDPTVSIEAIRFLGCLDLATDTSQDSGIDSFAAETLRLLRYDEENRTLVVTQRKIPLTICGETKSAQTDVCLLKRPEWILLVLLVVETRSRNLANPTQAEAQVIAGAIAAFQSNNEKRKKKGKSELSEMTIPCIIMFGTHPSFYLVPVTTELSNAVITGQYPLTETRVQKCDTKPSHTRVGASDSVGMENLVYRTLALEHFLAFKTLAKSHWDEVMNGL